jgi:hypothetical protein
MVQKQMFYISFNKKPCKQKRLRTTELIDFPLTKEQLDAINQTIVIGCQDKPKKKRKITLVKLPCKDIVLNIDNNSVYINHLGIVSKLAKIIL